MRSLCSDVIGFYVSAILGLDGAGGDTNSLYVSSLILIVWFIYWQLRCFDVTFSLYVSRYNRLSSGDLPVYREVTMLCARSEFVPPPIFVNDSCTSKGIAYAEEF